MKLNELLAQYNGDEVERFKAVFKTADPEKRIVYGEVYVPNVVDSHNEMMLPEDVELMAHRFLATLKNDQIDIMHDNRTISAVVVESFIARKGDPDYNEGAWVLGTKIDDRHVWKSIKTGQLNGYSIETYVRKADAVVDFTYFSHVFGLTEKVDGHHHYFFIQLDEDGSIVHGRTTKSGGHEHKISMATASEFANAHAHRIRLP